MEIRNIQQKIDRLFNWLGGTSPIRGNTARAKCLRIDRAVQLLTTLRQLNR